MRKGFPNLEWLSKHSDIAKNKARRALRAHLADPKIILNNLQILCRIRRTKGNYSGKRRRKIQSLSMLMII